MFVQVQTVTGNGSGLSLSVTLPSPVTPGNHIIVAAAAHGAGTVTGSIGTDSLGNAYNQDFYTSVNPTMNPASLDTKLLESYSAVVTHAGACTITYTLASAATGISLVVWEFSGLYARTNYSGQNGAAWIDHGAGEGSAPFPALTLHFATDFPPLASYYGSVLPVLGVITAFDTSLSTWVYTYPVAEHGLTVPWPSFPIGDAAVGLIMLYVGAASVGAVDCSITIDQAANSPFWLDIWVWRQLFAFAGIGQTIVLPLEYQRALTLALANDFARVCPWRNPQAIRLRLARAVAAIEQINVSNSKALEELPPAPSPAPQS